MSVKILNLWWLKCSLTAFISPYEIRIIPIPWFPCCFLDCIVALLNLLIRIRHRFDVVQSIPLHLTCFLLLLKLHLSHRFLCKYIVLMGVLKHRDRGSFIRANLLEALSY